jgi:hypothetical protein
LRQAKAECFQEQRVGDTRRYATPGNPFTRLANAQDSFKDDSSVGPQTQARTHVRVEAPKLTKRFASKSDDEPFSAAPRSGPLTIYGATRSRAVTKHVYDCTSVERPR